MLTIAVIHANESDLNQSSLKLKKWLKTPKWFFGWCYLAISELNADSAQKRKWEGVRMWFFIFVKTQVQ